MAYKRRLFCNEVRFREDRSEGGEGKSRGVGNRILRLLLWVTPEEEAAIRAKGRNAHSLSASSGGFPLYDGFNSLGIRAEKTRGMTWPEWSREAADSPRLPASRLTQPRSQGGRSGRAGITPAGPLRSKALLFSGFEVSRA